MHVDDGRAPACGYLANSLMYSYYGSRLTSPAGRMYKVIDWMFIPVK